MPTAHPFERLPGRSLGLLAGVSSAASLALGAWLLHLGRPLAGPYSPYGLASFELVGSESGMAELLGAWGRDGVARAVLMTWVDFAFLAAYALSLSSVSLLVAGARRFPTAARAAAWAGTIASACDLAENVLSLSILSGGAGSVGAMAVLAAVKFGLAGASLLWIVSGLFIPSPRD